MPNWCSQEISIYGETNEIKRFWDTIQGDDRQHIKLTNLMPMPTVLEGTTSPAPLTNEPNIGWITKLKSGEMTQEWYNKLVTEQINAYDKAQKALAETGYTDWYAWANNVWGTKWGDCETYLSEPAPFGPDFSYIGGNFETAWSPFYNSFWEHVTAQYDIAVVISMTEEADFFCGVQAFFEGTTLFDEVEDLEYPESISNMYDPDKEDDIDKYYDARNEYRQNHLDEQWTQAIAFLREATEGHATWSSWNSQSQMHPSRGLPIR